MAEAADRTAMLERAASDRTRRVLEIRVLEGPNAGLQRTIARGTGVVGRARAADVQLDDETVSQFHVELSTDGDEIFVHDLGSRNGTRAGSIVLERARVPSGTALVLGSSTMQALAGEPANKERSTATSFGALVGASLVMRERYAALARLARSDLAVLIEGATGTGKELAARALHDEGPRAREPFVALSCASLPPALAESILFGQEQAREVRAGIFETARGGTVLLDSVDELALELQAKLLRAVDQREVVPVGAALARRFDARVVSIATGLRERVNRGAFREDLYFRLAQARVEMPSLAQRPEDKKPLAQHFLALVRATPCARGFEPDALDALAARAYPGNVRELRNMVERAAILAEGPTITVQDLAFERVLAGAQPDAETHGERALQDDTSEPIEAFKDAKRTVIDDFERSYLERLLARAGKNVSRAAALAGIERQSLRALLKRHGVGGSDEER